MLRAEVEKMKKKHAEHHVKKTDIDPDIYTEYVSQRKYLEKSVSALKRHLQKDNEVQKQNSLRVMKENVKLIKKINKLRKGVKDIKLGAKVNEENANPKGPRPHTVTGVPYKENTDLEGIEISIADKKRMLGNFIEGYGSFNIV